MLMNLWEEIIIEPKKQRNVRIVISKNLSITDTQIILENLDLSKK
jgi:hypothetical protein